MIEHDITHESSLIYYVSLLELIKSEKILGIDTDICTHSHNTIETHPILNRIEMIEDSSISIYTIEKVKKFAADYKKFWLCLIVIIHMNIYFMN